MKKLVFLMLVILMVTLVGGCSSSLSYFEYSYEYSTVTATVVEYEEIIDKSYTENNSFIACADGTISSLNHLTIEQVFWGSYSFFDVQYEVEQYEYQIVVQYEGEQYVVTRGKEYEIGEDIDVKLVSIYDNKEQLISTTCM